MFEPLTILENLNWKGTFLQGQIFVKEYSESLNGYFVCGLSVDKKRKLITRFILSEDIIKCKVIDESEILQSYINERK